MNNAAPINPQQTLLRPGQLAALLGVSRATVHRWTTNDVRVARCLFRPGYFSVHLLREAGLLTPVMAQEAVVSDAVAPDAGVSHAG